MKRWFCLLLAVVITNVGIAQSIQQKLDEASKTLLADSQVKHAIVGFYVADAKSGQEIYSLNGSTLLAPASTQKIITSVAAFDLLGKDYKYKTELGYDGELDGDKLKGNLFFKGYGDPTLGSWRYEITKPEVVFAKWIDHLKKFGIKKITGNVVVDASAFSYQPLPGGWIWDDMGNYYGAGIWGINWNENQYDLLLNPGSSQGDKVKIEGTKPELENANLVNHLITGRKGSGDNAYIYYPPYSNAGFVEGTFEGGNKISGAIPNAPQHFAFELQKLFKQNKITVEGRFVTSEQLTAENKTASKATDVFHAHYSPGIDSIVYWFMKRSINQYGEALLKAIALEKTGVGSTDSGVAIIRRFYKEKGLTTGADLKVIDGSGLSPQNRVTAKSLVSALLYAKKQSWFDAFYQSFPDYNKMKLKSGTIGGAKSFAGYHTASNGKEYAVAIIVNSYDGSASSIVNKMFKLLDVLK